ncbi:MAG: 3-dehydroquinate synthase [Pseudomonadota bacterium]
MTDIIPDEWEKVSVDLSDRRYDIVIGEGVLGRCGTLISSHLKRAKTWIVTDLNVAEHHLQTVTSSLDEAGVASATLRLPAGEATKSFTHLEHLLDELIVHGVERSDTIVALGGGVIGDLTGFAAAILRRGVRFIQIPTTLLAQVDSSVGGKTGINVHHGKNLIGAFHQPQAVLIDIDTIATLPKRERCAGYAEIVKYGLINRPDFFAWLETEGAHILNAAPSPTRRAIAESCRTKAEIVARDERESGERALLNLGHTFGHALEALGGYDGRILHGEAVALGMVMAAEYSAHLGLCGTEISERIQSHFESVGMRTNVSTFGLRPTAEAMMTHMAQDKKVEQGALSLILMRGVGASFVAHGVDPAPLADYLNLWAARAH